MKYLLSLSPSPTVNRCYPPTPCFTNNAPPPFFIFFALNDKVLGFQLTNHMRALGSLPEAFRKIEREQGKRGVLSEDEFLHLALELSPQREVPPLPLLSISYPLIISLLPFTDTIFFFPSPFPRYPLHIFLVPLFLLPSCAFT